MIWSVAASPGGTRLSLLWGDCVMSLAPFGTSGCTAGTTNGCGTWTNDDAVTLFAKSPSSAVSWAAGTNTNSSLPLDLWASLEPSWVGGLNASLASAVSDVLCTPPSNARMPQASTSSYHPVNVESYYVKKNVFIMGKIVFSS